MSVATIERESAKLVADIMAAELGLDEKHCLLGDQAWDIPADKTLFLVVFAQTAKVIGGTAYLDTDSASATFGKEIQQSSVLVDCRIEMMSFDNSARVRMMEPGMALGGLLAQQLAEKNRVQIGRAQEPVNASETETTKRLQKFVIHVNLTALYQKVKEPPTADYFDKFNGATVAGSAKAPQIAAQE